MLQRAKKYLAYLKSDQCQDVDQCLEAYLTLSAIPSIQGQLPELFAKLGRMPKPESTKQLNKLAKCFLLANNAQRAAELFLESLNYSTQDSQALYGLAECNYALGHFNSAEALIFKSLAIIHQASEEAFTMYQFLACLYIDLTEGRKAITFASKYLERYPDHLATKCNLIKGYIYEQNIVHAKRLLTEAAKAHGQNRQLDECTEILKVQTAMLNKSMGSASTQIDSINPEVSIYQNLSNGQFEVVKKQALELITKGESAHLAHLALGQVYEIEGNYQQALVHLEEASKVMHTPEVMMVMLRSYIRLQDYDHAQPLAIHLLATCRATHGKKDIRNLLILYTHITEIALSTNNIAEAIRIFETLKKEEKGTKEEMESLSKHLAYLYNSVDDFAQANIHITDAIKYSTRPDSSLFRMQGNIQLKSQDIAGAIQSYKKSLEIEPRNAGLNYNLGIYYLLFKKDVAKAKKYTQLALELDPSIDNILDEVLPAELKELLTAEDRVEEKQELLTPPSVARDKEEEKEKEDHTLNAAMAVLDIQKPSVAELTVAPPVTITELSEEQLKHKYLQNEKKRTLEQLSAERAQASAYETEPYWMIPSMGKISLHDDRVTKLSIGNCNPEKSHLHAMLDNKLENESKWEDRVIRGKIARKKGEQGIRLLTQEEQNKVQQKLGAGYVAKIKVLGQDGDKRYYGRSFSAVGGPENRLLFFDRLVDKHAAMNR
jgi:tetratricopeptide (TPR) repeat protein